MSLNQKTIKKQFSFKGVGLHTGRKCQAHFKPAPSNTGIQFIRVDLPGKPVFPARIENVVDVIRGTTLGVGENRVYTIEHILSALSGLQIDNMMIELDDLEPPVADGSSIDFVEAILEAGLEEQGEPKSIFAVDHSIDYSAHQTHIHIEPAEEFEIQCEIDYNHPLLKNQQFIFKESDNYQKEIAPARTFCFDYEIEALKKKGLAKGGSLDNAIVIGPTGIYNGTNFLRFENEFVRHKILDLMGDLTLLGQRIKGRIVAKRCGHGHNINFIKKLLQEKPLSSPVSVR